MKKQTKLVISACSLFASLLFLISLFSFSLSSSVCLGLAALALFAGAGVPLLLFFQKEGTGKTLFAAQILCFVALFFSLTLKEWGISALLSDLTSLKAILLGAGSGGVAVALLLVVANVVLLPLPATLFYIAIAAVYGGARGFLICYIGTLIGSYISFFIGKYFGLRAVFWCIGKEKAEKYSLLLHQKGKLPFILMQLLPFFPDDVLCMVAGLSGMSYRFFSAVMLFAKPFYIALVCFLGQTESVLFSAAAPFWISLIALLTLLSILYAVKQDKIDAALSSFFKKSRKTK
ncbi:MAG: VTT domain-containing protein [Clostridia bacterium]|nr:VTT domain-containing protein [Clostridia bacterium]